MSSRTAARSISLPANPAQLHSRVPGQADGRRERTARGFATFHPQVRHVLASCPSVHKWALFDGPLDRWGDGNITLLGDACHPMTPYMAQGAAMAMEDAAMLSRCLTGVERDGVADAFRRFEGNAQAANVPCAIELAHQYLAENADRSGLGLRLRRLERTARGARSGLSTAISPNSSRAKSSNGRRRSRRAVRRPTERPPSERAQRAGPGPDNSAKRDGELLAGSALDTATVGLISKNAGVFRSNA